MRGRRGASWGETCRSPPVGGILSTSASNSVMSLRFPAVNVTAKGRPCPSQITWCFEPGRRRSTGEGPVFSPPLCSHVRTVNNRAGPVDTLAAAQFVCRRPRMARRRFQYSTGDRDPINPRNRNCQRRTGWSARATSRSLYPKSRTASHASHQATRNQSRTRRTVVTRLKSRLGNRHLNGAHTLT
jgi:hypothetical protein